MLSPARRRLTLTGECGIIAPIGVEGNEYAWHTFSASSEPVEAE
jgi:hypothetical protein